MAGPDRKEENGSKPYVISRKVKETMKEATGATDDEVDAMLRQCNGDANLATEKLLDMDPFEKVTSKKDKRKQTDDKGRKDTKLPEARRPAPSSGGRGRGRGEGRGGRGYSGRFGGRGPLDAAQRGFPLKSAGEYSASVPGASSTLQDSWGTGETAASDGWGSAQADGNGALTDSAQAPASDSWGASTVDNSWGTPSTSAAPASAAPPLQTGPRQKPPGTSLADILKGTTAKLAPAPAPATPGTQASSSVPSTSGGALDQSAAAAPQAEDHPVSYNGGWDAAPSPAVATDGWGEPIVPEATASSLTEDSHTLHSDPPSVPQDVYRPSQLEAKAPAYQPPPSSAVVAPPGKVATVSEVDSLQLRFGNFGLTSPGGEFPAAYTPAAYASVAQTQDQPVLLPSVKPAAPQSAVSAPAATAQADAYKPGSYAAIAPANAAGSADKGVSAGAAASAASLAATAAAAQQRATYATFGQYAPQYSSTVQHHYGSLDAYAAASDSPHESSFSSTADAFGAGFGSDALKAPAAAAAPSPPAPAAFPSTSVAPTYAPVSTSTSSTAQYQPPAVGGYGAQAAQGVTHSSVQSSSGQAKYSAQGQGMQQFAPPSASEGASVSTTIVGTSTASSAALGAPTQPPVAQVPYGTPGMPPGMQYNANMYQYPYFPPGHMYNMYATPYGPYSQVGAGYPPAATSSYPPTSGSYPSHTGLAGMAPRNYSHPYNNPSAAGASAGVHGYGSGYGSGPQSGYALGTGGYDTDGSVSGYSTSKDKEGVSSGVYSVGGQQGGAVAGSSAVGSASSGSTGAGGYPGAPAAQRDYYGSSLPSSQQQGYGLNAAAASYAQYSQYGGYSQYGVPAQSAHASGAHGSNYKLQ